MLLPSSFFEASAKRMAWLKANELTIDCEFKVGAQCYRPNTTVKKRTPDSIFLFRKTVGPSLESHMHYATYLCDTRKLPPL